MEIKAERLCRALELLEPAVPTKNVKMPILTNVLLGDGRAVAQNLEIAVMVDLPEAQEPMLLPFRPMANSYPPTYPISSVALPRTCSWPYSGWPG